MKAGLPLAECNSAIPGNGSGGLGDATHQNHAPDGRIVSITKHVFIRSVVADHHLFKVPEDSWTTFVSELVKRAIEASPLKGLLIEEAP
jgi:hypothetical protein